jgi:CBS domain-containing protein
MTYRCLAEIVRRQRPVKLSISATVQAACRQMRDKQVGAVLVTGGGDCLVGVFTSRDAVSRVLAEALNPTTTLLGVVMTPQPDTLKPDAHAIDALRMMQDGGYRHLAIVDGTRIVGLVSHSDFSGLGRARLNTENGFWEIP